QSRYSISFPRLRPCTGGVEPASIMDERQLVQTICAFRLLAPEEILLFPLQMVASVNRLMIALLIHHHAIQSQRLQLRIFSL
ncbi:hypothetical protein V5G94_25110, partial [Citrobacter braakii]